MKKIIIIILLSIFPLEVYGIDISARSAIMLDMDTKRILYSKNINEQRSVASISKIMTAVLAIESGKMDDIVTIGDEIDKSYGSGIYIEKGEEITLRDLVYGLMLRSGNDASYAIANYLDGDNFVDLMNKKAKEIGMINTVFNNPNGLDEEKGNYSTAFDMAILTSYANKIAEYRKIVSTKKYVVKTNKKTYKWTNKNRMLFNYKYATGGKTGFTHKAKRTLVTTASKKDLNLVVVTLNDGDDFNDHKRLFEYGFNNFYKKQLLKKGNIDLYSKVYNGKYKLSVENDYINTFNKNDKIVIEYVLSSKPIIGYSGMVKVIVNGREYYKDNIVCTKIKKKKHFWEMLKLW